MRVLLVAESLRPQAASVALALVGLQRELKAHGMHATLLAADTAGAEKLGFDAPSVHPSHADDPLVAVGAHEVVHLFGWGYPLAQKSLAAIKLARKPYAVSPLGFFDGLDKRSLGQRVRWWLGDRRRVDGARCLLAMNEWELQALRGAKIHPRVELLPLGLSDDEFSNRATTFSADSGGPSSSSEGGVTMMDGDRVMKLDSAAQSKAPTCGRSSATGNLRANGSPAPYILVLGPIDPPSGAAALLKALAEIGPDADGWSVVFAGHLELHWKQMLEAAVRRKGGEERVRFIHDPDLATQRTLLARCGTLVAPTLRSRPPIAMMQAVASGIPACGTKCAAPPEIDCLTCEPNRSAMRDMLRTMLQRSDAERRESALRLQDQAKRQLAWLAIIDRYISLYRGTSEPRP